MLAFANDRYGTFEVLERRDVPVPSPGPRDVLVRVHATPVNSGDLQLLGGGMFAVRVYWGLLRPRRKVLGWALSGVVEAVGAEVTRFAPGDTIFGETKVGGAWAELALLPEDYAVRKPESLSHVEACSIPVGAFTALQGLRDKGRIAAGQRVLIHGASGGVGIFAVQIAKHFGAHVTGTASASKHDLVRDLGADEVLDYRTQDFTAMPERYDLILDMVGDKPVGACTSRLTDAGRYVIGAGNVGRTLRASLFGGKQVEALIAKANHSDLEQIRAWVEAGELRTVIDREVPFDELPEAVRHAASGEARGKVVVTLQARAL